MYKPFFLPLAEKDLGEIFEYTIEEWSYQQAIKYTSLINDCINDICKEKIIGRNYTHTSKPYKCAKVGKHLIFFRIENDVCFIVRILHENMDIEEVL